MQKVPIRAFVLSHAQLKLAYAMIRSAELRTHGRKPHAHDLLCAKIQAALIRSRQQSWPQIHLDQEECQLMCRYNNDYCCVMADSDDEGEEVNSDVMRRYRTANQIQIIFSSSKFIFK